MATVDAADEETDQPKDQGHDQDDPQRVHGKAETAEDRKYQQQRKKSNHAAPRFLFSGPRPSWTWSSGASEKCPKGRCAKPKMAGARFQALRGRCGNFWPACLETRFEGKKGLPVLP
jgi:hypothetical protein